MVTISENLNLLVLKPNLFKVESEFSTTCKNTHDSSQVFVVNEISSLVTEGQTYINYNGIRMKKSLQEKTNNDI